MREITKPNGEVYAKVWIDESTLQIQISQQTPALTIVMDAKVIPQLRQILAEAEFFKHI